METTSPLFASLRRIADDVEELFHDHVLLARETHRHSTRRLDRVKWLYLASAGAGIASVICLSLTLAILLYSLLNLPMWLCTLVSAFAFVGAAQGLRWLGWQQIKEIGKETQQSLKLLEDFVWMARKGMERSNHPKKSDTGSSIGGQNFETIPSPPANTSSSLPMN